MYTILQKFKIWAQTEGPSQTTEGRSQTTEGRSQTTEGPSQSTEGRNQNKQKTVKIQNFEFLQGG